MEVPRAEEKQAPTPQLTDCAVEDGARDSKARGLDLGYEERGLCGRCFRFEAGAEGLA